MCIVGAWRAFSLIKIATHCTFLVLLTNYWRHSGIVWHSIFPCHSSTEHESIIKNTFFFPNDSSSSVLPPRDSRTTMSAKVSAHQKGLELLLNGFGSSWLDRLLRGTLNANPFGNTWRGTARTLHYSDRSILGMPGFFLLMADEIRRLGWRACDDGGCGWAYKTVTAGRKVQSTEPRCRPRARGPSWRPAPRCAETQLLERWRRCAERPESVWAVRLRCPSLIQSTEAVTNQPSRTCVIQQSRLRRIAVKAVLSVALAPNWIN